MVRGDGIRSVCWRLLEVVRGEAEIITRCMLALATQRRIGLEPPWHTMTIRGVVAGALATTLHGLVFLASFDAGHRNVAQV